MNNSCSTDTPEKRLIPKKIKKWWCSNCRKRSSVRIIFGYPFFDAFEASERGEFWLGGCCLPPSGEFPLTHCLACGHEDFVKYETKKSLCLACGHEDLVKYETKKSLLYFEKEK
jgi:hypothetical protein